MSHPSKEDNLRQYTREEVAARKDSKEIWLIIHNRVYNITAFLNEHPGGEEVLLEQSGQDCTEAFEDVGHSSDARAMMENYLVGDIVASERINADTKSKEWSVTDSEPSNSSWKSWLVPVALCLLATFAYRYFLNFR